jgi:hypothetical protein
MAGLRRREYKVKETSAFETIDSQLKDFTTWDEAFSFITNLLGASNPDSRLSAMRALNHQLNAHYIGDDLESAADSLVSGLGPSLTTRYASRAEHDEALSAVCNLSLQLFSGFETCAGTMVELVLQTLPSLPSDCAFRLWALPFVAAFSFPVESSVPGIVLSEVLRLLTTKNARGVRYTPEMTVEGIWGVNLLLAVLPIETIVSDFLETVMEMTDRRLMSKKPEVVRAALETLLVVHDVLVQHCAIAEPDDLPEVEERLQDFTNSYPQKFRGLVTGSLKKADQKMIKSRCSEITKIFEGESENNDEITLTSQVFVIAGGRNLTVLNAIRRIAGCRFEQQMTGNLGIHELLGIKLMSKLDVKKFKKSHHTQIQHDRATTKRENEQKRAGDRKKKEDRDVESE